MNEIEAIKRLKECIEDCTSGEDEIYAQAFGIGILALEKQIPKKAIFVECRNNWLIYKCNTCGNTFFAKTNKTKYCKNCGQRLE